MVVGRPNRAAAVEDLERTYSALRATLATRETALRARINEIATRKLDVLSHERQVMAHTRDEMLRAGKSRTAAPRPAYPKTRCAPHSAEVARAHVSTMFTDDELLASTNVIGSRIDDIARDVQTGAVPSAPLIGPLLEVGLRFSAMTRPRARMITLLHAARNPV